MVPVEPSPRRAFVRLVIDVPAREDEWVLPEEDMPESTFHRDAVRLLELVLLAFVARTGRNALVAANLACRWSQEYPRAGLDPDVALIEPAPPVQGDLKSVRTWEAGFVPPRFAVEVVSDSNAEKDYVEGPVKYARLGTRELVIFDPKRRGPAGFDDVLQVWRREEGPTMVRVYSGDGPARSEELDAWLVPTPEGHLRIADDEKGHELWPTEAEAEAAARKREAAAHRREAAAHKREAAARQLSEAALRRAIEDICELCGVPLDDTRRAQLAAMDLPRMEQVRAILKRDRKWPVETSL